MVSRDPIAFLSYVQADDDHDGGGISTFRRRLEGEVKMQTGRIFDIFQDRNDLQWGQHWEQRIKGALGEISFLISVITPSYFLSPACRMEFNTFLNIEQTQGVNRLILPLYYCSSDELEAPAEFPNSIADVLRARQWEDWRPFRFKEYSDAEVRKTLARIAGGIKGSIDELKSIAKASERKENIAIIDDIDQLEAISGELVESRPIYRPDYPIPVVRAADGTIDKSARDKPYRAYTTDFDEVLSASAVAGDPAEMVKLQKQVSRTVSSLEKANAEYLSRLALRRVDRTKMVSVSILIDNSGSLRGEPARFLAAWSVLLMKWFERLDVRSEFLGYTTRAWKGGRSRETWLSGGKPSEPGRLNDLRHIVYKSFDETVAMSMDNCAVMMRPNLFKENIDGEALLWAHDRLLLQPLSEKLLFVVSDGAPVDDSTLSVNDGNLLHLHLKGVARWIDDSRDVALEAVGIKQDLSTYYENSTRVEMSNLGISILRAVEKIVVKPLVA